MTELRRSLGRELVRPRELIVVIRLGQRRLDRRPVEPSASEVCRERRVAKPLSLSQSTNERARELRFVKESDADKPVDLGLDLLIRELSPRQAVTQFVTGQPAARQRVHAHVADSREPALIGTEVVRILLSDGRRSHDRRVGRRGQR